jgi:hypothetical protein
MQSGHCGRVSGRTFGKAQILIARQLGIEGVLQHLETRQGLFSRRIDSDMAGDLGKIAGREIDCRSKV